MSWSLQVNYAQNEYDLFTFEGKPTMTTTGGGDELTEFRSGDAFVYVNTRAARSISLGKMSDEKKLAAVR